MAEPTYRGAASVAREVDLIARIGAGDRRAFEELYNLYHRRMARFLTRLTRRYDVAEEVINDTFLVVWRKARDFRGDSQPSTWILGIAYRKARSAFRTSARLAQKNLEAESLPLTSSDEPFRTEELRDWLEQALALLPVEQRLAVELCYELGYSCDEIAVIMNCPANTVKTRLFHARAKLQKLLPQLAAPIDLAAGGCAPERAGASRVMMASRACPHEEIWLLLPWLANGRLSGAQRAQAEEHVRECALCAQAIATERQLCALLTQPERVTYAPGPSLRKLMERLDDAPPAPALPAPPRPHRSRATLAATWRPPGLAWAATFVLTIGLGALLATTYRWSQTPYATVTTATPATPDVLHIAFERSLPVGEVEELLRSAGARVVEGPGSSGIFGIAPLTDTALGSAQSGEVSPQMRALAARLRADARVRWVEPLAAESATDDAQGRRTREP